MENAEIFLFLSGEYPNTSSGHQELKNFTKPLSCWIFPGFIFPSLECMCLTKSVSVPGTPCLLDQSAECHQYNGSVGYLKGWPGCQTSPVYIMREGKEVLCPGDKLAHQYFCHMNVYCFWSSFLIGFENQRKGFMLEFEALLICFGDDTTSSSADVRGSFLVKPEVVCDYSPVSTGTKIKN